MTDLRLLLAAGFVRALATGLAGVLLGLHLAAIRTEPGAAGAIVAAGLAGAALATLAVTLGADRAGHRATLAGLALLSGAGGLAVAALSAPLAIGAAAFLGMLNGMGRDRGGALVLEQAIIPGAVGDAARTGALARYHLLQDMGHALGGLLAALPARLAAAGAPPALASTRGTLVLYAILSLAPLALYARLSAAVEPVPTRSARRLSPEARAVVTRISSLFALDALGGGFLTTALLTYIFHERFGVGGETLGPLFFAARILNAGSHLAAAWLAARIGLVRTMVFTHIPSSLLLVTVAFAPSFPVAAALFLLREGLVEMDVPTRQSYVMALVQPEERTAASGVTHIVRLAAWAVAPSFAGLLMRGTSIVAPLVVGAAMKIGYDLLLYRAFRDVRPPEERATAPPRPAAR